MDLKDKTVLITGASAGIGEACARVFGEAGAKVSLAARRQDRLDKIAKELKEKGILCTVKATDVSQEDQVKSLVDHTIAEFGRIDILINNAGLGCEGHIADVNIDFVKQIVNVNYLGALYCIQAVIPHMRKQQCGHIINMSSISGKRSFPGIGIYCSTKFALNALGDALRLEEKKKGIAVTSICPNFTETEFTQQQLRPAKLKPIRMRFPGQTAEQVAKAVLRAAETRPREVHLTLAGKFLIRLERFSPWLMDQVLKMQHLVYGRY